MKLGDKILCEGEITAMGEGFVRVRFPRVGAQAVAHVRVSLDNCHQKPAKKAARAD